MENFIFWDNILRFKFPVDSKDLWTIRFVSKVQKNGISLKKINLSFSTHKINTFI